MGRGAYGVGGGPGGRQESLGNPDSSSGFPGGCWVTPAGAYGGSQYAQGPIHPQAHYPGIARPSTHDSYNAPYDLHGKESLHPPYAGGSCREVEIGSVGKLWKRIRSLRVCCLLIAQKGAYCRSRAVGLPGSFDDNPKMKSDELLGGKAKS